jgi:DME family drug/metabolite transporter
VGIGEIGVLGSAALWACSAVMLRSQTGRLPILALNGFTGGYAALVFLIPLVLLGRVGELLQVPPSTLVGLLGSILLGMAVGDTLYLRAMHAIGVSRALPIATTYPIPTAVLSLVVLGESVTWRTFAGTLLVVGGVYLVALRDMRRASRSADGAGDPEGGQVGRGVLFAVGAALCWAVAPIMLRPALDQVDPMLANAIRLPTACVVLIALSLRGGAPPRHPFAYGRRTAGLLALAGLCNGLSSILWLIGLHEAGAAKAAALSSTAPIFAAPLAALVLRERLTSSVWLGTVLTVAGVALVL